MTSPDYIKINGVSSHTINVWVDTPPVPPMARQKYTVWTSKNDIQGTTADNVYEDITYAVTMYVFKDENYNNTEIYSFFSAAETLEISRVPEFYYKIKQVAVDASEDYDGNRIRYTVTFKLSPFRYSIENPAITLAKNDIVTNKGTRYSKPLYRIEGSGDISLIVNGESLQIKDVSEVVNIDCERLVIYDDAGNNFLPKSNGKLPFLASGENLITWFGNVTQCTVKMNERWY